VQLLENTSHIAYYVWCKRMEVTSEIQLLLLLKTISRARKQQHRAVCQQ